MKQQHDVSISFDTDGGAGNIAIVKEYDDLSIVMFRYRQLGGGTMYHNHPIPMQKGPEAIREALTAALSQPQVWGVRTKWSSGDKHSSTIPEEWILTLMRAAETVWGVDKRLTC